MTDGDKLEVLMDELQEKGKFWALKVLAERDWLYEHIKPLGKQCPCRNMLRTAGMYFHLPACKTGGILLALGGEPERAFQEDAAFGLALQQQDGASGTLNLLQNWVHPSEVNQEMLERLTSSGMLEFGGIARVRLKGLHKRASEVEVDRTPEQIRCNMCLRFFSQPRNTIGESNFCASCRSRVARTVTTAT